MRKLLKRWVCGLALGAMAFGFNAGAHAAVVVNATNLGSSIRFVVSSDEAVALADIAMQLMVDDVFALSDGEKFDPYPGGPAGWYTFGDVPDPLGGGSFSISSFYSTASDPAMVTLFGTVADLFQPVAFAAGAPIFDFELVLRDPLAQRLVFSFSGGAFGSDEFVFDGEGSIAAIPEPSTYALMLAGLLGLGFIARRRRA